MPIEKFNNLTDEELLRNYYSDDDNYWLGILFQRYTLLLFGVAMKYLKNTTEAQDAVQQIFLKSITEVKKNKVTYFKSWLHVVAKNYCLLMLRDKNKSTPISDEFLIPDEEIDFLSIQHDDKTLTAIEQCLPKLNKEQNTCLTLFYLQRKSYQEVCTLTNFSMLQVKSHIQNGKRNLKILVEKSLKQ